jgi:hypothetical protein
MLQPAIAELKSAFENPFGELGNSPGRDRDAVVLSWPSVPLEIIHACGLRAVIARSGASATPNADQRLEPGVFPPRLHQLVEAALTGRLAHVAAILLPRTSDPDYKCFLYLREFARRGIGGPFPPIVLFDLLQSDSPEAGKYNKARIHELWDRLSGWSGTRPQQEQIRDAVLRANTARAAAKRLLQLRCGIPRIAGYQALPLLGAYWQLPAPRYVGLIESVVAHVRTLPPRTGPRLFLAGVPVDSPTLHAAVESRAAVVVDELGPYGSDAAGDDVLPGEDMLDALVQRSRVCPTTARTPLKRMRQRIERALFDVDAVLVNQTDDDSSFGWDYPWLRSLLARRAIPHMIVKHSGNGLPPAQLLALDALVDITQRRAVLHG